MAYPIAAGTTISTAAYTKSLNLMLARHQFLPKGRVQLFALPSATGMKASFLVNGVAIMDDQDFQSFGTTGGMSMKDNIVFDQVIAGGTAEFYLRNTTAGALTTDYVLLFTPM